MAATGPGRFQAPEVRRRQILTAASTLAVERGLDSVSIAQVAEAAGLAKGSIYLHFDSRADLIAALQADLWATMLDRPAEIAADGSLSWTRRLDDTVAHLVRFSLEHEDLYHAVFHATSSVAEEPWDQSRELLRKLLLGGKAAGEFAIDDLDVTTDFLLHAYAGPCYHVTDPDRAVAGVQQLFRRVVGATAATP